MNTFDYIVKKYNINVGRQYFIEIPEMKGGVDLAKLFAELKFNKGVELGVGLGEYTEVLLKANPKLQLSAIDAWKISAYPKGFYEQSVAGGHSKPEELTQEFWDGWYKESVKTLKPYKNCTIIRKLSMDALDDFKDNSLDFVYIDAGHDFMNFTFDLHHWKDKVRIGGIVSGHDYSTFPGYKMIHVKQVLTGYSTSYKMLPLFTLSRRRDSMKRDLYGNWFWVKDK